MNLPNIIEIISTRLTKQNAKAIVVGGSVRDHFLNLPIKDYDIEVYGLDRLEELETILTDYGSVNLVGKSFGVLKFTYNGEEYDFSFPRIELKIGSGHCGFDIKVDGFLNFKEASKRRDFTINAIGYDIETKEFLDPFNGFGDIELKILKHIDDDTFSEDPLRVYRAIQFVARFNFTLDSNTFLLCKKMVEDGMLDELPKERVYMEWKKLLIKASKPSIGFELMRELNLLKSYFPELHAIIKVPQSSKWHSVEGDVWTDTMMSLDIMRRELRDMELEEKDKLRLLFATLCHNFGKATTTTMVYKDGVHLVQSIGYEYAGVELTKRFIYRLTDEHYFIDSILPLVEHHLKPSQFYRDNSKDATIRRLATKVNIEELVLVAKADFLGRTTHKSLTEVYCAGDWLLEKSRSLNVLNNPPKRLLQGKDLISLGLDPSPIFKELLDTVYLEQIDGKVTTKDEAIEFIKELLNL